MRRYLPSASRLGLARLCGFPWSDEAPAWPPRVQTDAARFGTAFGRCVELVAIFASDGCFGGKGSIATSTICDLVMTETPLPPAESKKLALAVAYARDFLESSEPDFRAVEMVIAYCIDTGEARVSSREETLPEGWQRCALDLVERNGDTLDVYDWKTGERTAAEASADSDDQLRLYAIVLALALKHEGPVRVHFLHASEEGIRADHFEHDEYGLALGLVGTRRLLASLPTAQPKPGRHCATKYCPIVAACPVTQRALVEVQGADPLPMTLTPASADEVRETRLAVQRIRKALPAFDAAIETWALKHGAFEVSPGIMFGARQRNGSRKFHVVNGVPSLLRRHLGDDADEAIAMSTSAAAIERATITHARALGLEEKGAHKRFLDPIVEELTGIDGAVTRGAPVTMFEEFKARQPGSKKSQSDEESSE